MVLKEALPYFNNEYSKHNFEYKFTVFTPAYNAEKTIRRVHSSLLKQTFTDFEWLIINDGSTDKTNSCILKIVESSPLSINYIKKSKNQHKMACFMEAISVAKGEFFLTFDADDECIPEALQIFVNEYSAIPDSLKHNISGVTGLCMDQNKNLVGKHFPQDSYYSNTFLTTAIDKVKGEKWGFTKTDILKNINFPKLFANNGYIPEGIIWCLIAKKGYKTRYFNTVVRIYHMDIEESITSSPLKKNILGPTVHSIAYFNWFFKDYFLKAPIFFLKNLYFLLRLSKFSNFRFKEYMDSVTPIIIKFAIFILWPFRKILK